MPVSAQTKTLPERLTLKPGQRLAALNVPVEVRPLLDPLPEGASASNRLGGRTNVALVFVKDQADLEARVPKVLDGVDRSAVVWVGYPKRSGSIKTDITRDTVGAWVQEHGWKAVANIPADTTWSLVRFKFVG